MTYGTLMLPGFEPPASIESTPSAAGSPARMSRSPARVPAWTVSDPDSGESLRVSLASFDPDSRSWRTLGLFEGEDSLLYSETLPRSGMTRSGTLYLLPPLVRLTSVIGSGSSASLPTPMASDADKPRRSPASIARGGGPKLLDVLLPTPTSSSGGMAGQRGKPARGANPGVSLSDWALGFGGPLLPTPQAQDSRNCADYSDGSRGHSPQLRHLGKGRLNPRFVEWMMNFPPGWTDVEWPDKTGSA